MRYRELTKREIRERAASLALIFLTAAGLLALPVLFG
jgi:hypothetical protein